MTESELQDALEDAESLPEGDGKIAELERIVGHADAGELTQVSIEARFALIEAYQNHTETWRMLPVFSWCLRTYDQQPEQFDEWQSEMLRWYHKWAVMELRSSHRVGLAQTRATLDDLERRFQAGGHSLQAVYNLRCRIADHLGDRDEARRWLELWRTAARDENSDCDGCDPSAQAAVLANGGDDPAAIALLEQALSENLSCERQPERALSGLMLPYLRQGRFAEAARAHLRAYRGHRHNREEFPALADHLRFRALSGNVDRGVDLLEEHLGWLDRPSDDEAAMTVSAAGALVCRLADEAGLGDRRLQRPAHGSRPATTPTVAALAAELAGTARELAAKFDARNSNDHQSRRVAAILAARPAAELLVEPVPLVEPVAAAAEPADPEAGPVVTAHTDLVVPPTTEMITAILSRNGYGYTVDDDGTVSGRWDDATVRFDLHHEHGDVLGVRISTDPTLPAAHRDEAYRFCNRWNHDTLVPTALVYELPPDADVDPGRLRLVARHSVSLATGVTEGQLEQLLDTALHSAVTYARAAEEVAPGPAD